VSEAEEFINLAEESFRDLQKIEGVSDRMFWNSIYYSIFYAAKAALLEQGFEPKSHQGVDSLIGKVFYKDEEFISSEDAKFFSRMKTAREEIDYNPNAKIDYDKGKMEQKARKFIQLMKQIKEK